MSLDPVMDAGNCGEVGGGDDDERLAVLGGTVGGPAGAGVGVVEIAGEKNERAIGVADVPLGSLRAGDGGGRGAAVGWASR